jgi:type 1 glutamine amidotransferase
MMGMAGMMGTAGVTATAGMTGTGGGAGAGTGGAVGIRSGPFKIIVLSTTLEFRHDSIPTCMQMLKDLGQATAPERATIANLDPTSTWTVDHIGDGVVDTNNNLDEVSSDNLKNYELFYSDNPTGKVFTQAPMASTKMAAFQEYWNNGGSWAGNHSATDFQNSDSWDWWQNNINGGWFTEHDGDGTPGTINWEAQYAQHPILKGLKTPWDCTDEWYVENRDIGAVPGFQVLAKVTVSNSTLTTMPRPAIWITENANMMGGRSFYTIRGHNQLRYAEPEFRQLMLRGILWAVHRLPGGN